MEQTNPSLHPEFQGDPAEPHDGHGSENGGKWEKNEITLMKLRRREKVTDISP